jgi:glycosyltransferase involved in cell wall biosynthesis/phospholipid N-methyltransferase
MLSLSVLVPVYNEEHLVATSLSRLEILETSPLLSRVQVIVVDDCSRDGTAEVLNRFISTKGLAARGDGAPRTVGRPGSRIEWTFLRHERNCGKGRAIQTALAHANGDVTVIHDADLEYHPTDLLHIAKVFDDEGADAVFGSRFAGSESRRVLLFRHELGNKLLTFLTNLVTNLNLTDMETCYKAVRTDLLKSIPIVSNDFRLEPELAIKLAKREARLFEVPIRYSGRTYQEGKKINWVDGVKALAAIVRFAVSDDIYVPDAHGSQILGRLARAPRLSEWMADVIRPWCGTRVLEIGSGLGAITRSLVPRRRYVASDVNPLHLQTLQALQGDRPYLEAQFCDVTDLATYPRLEEGFDTVIALNVLEHVEDDVAALRNVRSVLAPGGRAIVLVPQGERLFGSLDEVLGHRRRYSEATLRRLAQDAGLAVRECLPFNRIGTPAWWINARLMRRRSFGLVQVLGFNQFVPILRKVDRVLPFPPLSLVAVLEPMGSVPVWDGGAEGREATLAEPTRRASV